jgi:hypothetical protein
MDNFSTDEVPFDTLGLIGLPKDKLLELDKDNLMRFFSGRRTDILRFDFYSQGKRIMFDGKLLLERKNEKATVSIVPVRKQIDNQYNLTNDELIKLYCGKLISKNIDGQRHLLQLDRETNEIIRAKTAHISFPFQVDNKERENLLKGKSIVLHTDSGNTKVRIDLLNDKGFSLNGETQRVRYVGTHFTETDLKTLQIEQYNLKQDDMQRLLDGNKTSLLVMQDGAYAKLRLERNDDKSVSIQLFPVKNEINNDLHLTPEQIDRIKNGETVVAQSGDKMLICQLDRETNDLLRREMSDVIPGNIRGIELKQSDKDNLFNGKSVSLLNQITGENVVAKLDLNNKNGITIDDDSTRLKKLFEAGEKANLVLESNLPNKIERDKFIDRNGLDLKDLANTARAAFDEKQKFYFDYHNPGIVGFIRTDENRVEFLAFTQNTKALSVKM